MWFWFFLANELGMGVQEAQGKISSREFAYWKGFYRIKASGGSKEPSRIPARQTPEEIIATMNAYMASVG